MPRIWRKDRLSEGYCERRSCSPNLARPPNSSRYRSDRKGIDEDCANCSYPHESCSAHRDRTGSSQRAILCSTAGTLVEFRGICQYNSGALENVVHLLSIEHFCLQMVQCSRSRPIG